MTDSPHREFFNAIAAGGKSMRLALWPRGHLKSSCVVVEIVRRILNDPDIRVLVMQATQKLSMGWLKEIRSHFDGSNPKSNLPLLFPEFCAASEKEPTNPKTLGTNLHFTVPARTRQHLKEATVTAASPKAITTGQHYTLMCFDDLVNANNFRNVELLDKLESEFYHFLPLLDPGGEVIVTGTRYSHADLYARLMSKEGFRADWECTVRECFNPDGTLLFPTRPSRDGKRTLGFTEELLAKLRRDDPEMFAPQYLNKIMAGKNQPFPSHVILSAVRATKDSEYPAYAPPVFMIDLAESKRADSDHSVVTVGRRDNQGRLWIVDSVGGTYSASELCVVIANLALKYRPARILMEKSPGATFFVELLKHFGRERNLNLPVDLLKTSRNKDAKYLRISALQGAFNGKRLFLCAGITDFARLEKEFTEFPRGRHDDRPDCIALLYSFYMDAGGARPINPPVKNSWVVNAVLMADTEPQITTSRSLCGDGFVG